MRAKASIWISTFLLTALSSACTGPISAREVDVPSTPGITISADSPLEEFLNLLWGTELSDEEFQLRFDAQNVQRENLVAQCMREQGFDYLPDLERVQLVFGDGNPNRVDDPDWVAQYGYGWARQPSDTVGRGLQVGFGGTSPNEEHLATLAPAEAAAWRDALTGPRWWLRGYSVDEWFDSADFSDPLAVGCQPWAQRAVEDDPTGVRDNAEFAPLLEAIDQMTSDLAFGVSEADRAWSTCMSDAGHPGFERQSDASNLILDELNDSGDLVWGSPEWQEFRAAIGSREIELALADLDCRNATDFRARQEALQIATHTQFVNDHRAALEALRSAMEQG